MPIIIAFKLLVAKKITIPNNFTNVANSVRQLTGGKKEHLVFIVEAV